MAADMLASAFALQAASWLITYLIHSTLLLGGVWVVTRLGLVGGPGGREALWKAALVAGLLTATAQVGLGSIGIGSGDAPPGVWAYKAEGAPARVADIERVGQMLDVTIRRRIAVTEAGSPVGMTGASKRIEATITEPSAACLAALRQPSLSLDQRLRDATEVCGASSFTWLLAVLIVWGVGSTLLLVRLVYARVLLRSALAGRVAVDSGEAREVLDELLQNASVPLTVRLTAAPGLESPAVVGPREICLPLRAEDGLTASELRVVLAHELAHMARRDLLWTTLARMLGAMLFFQPLNRLALREIEAEAEFLCDDWAVEHTGDPVVLARSLTRISEWLTRPSPAPVLAMVRNSGSSLTRRVQRILAPVGERPRTSRARVIALVVLLIGLTSVTPRVRLPGYSSLRLVMTDGGEIGSRARLLQEDLTLPEGQSLVFVRAVEVEAAPTP